MRVYHMNDQKSKDFICFPVDDEPTGYPGFGCFGGYTPVPYLVYKLTKHEKALAFQVQRQSVAVSSFLNAGNRFQASNGLIVASGPVINPMLGTRGGDYPEYMASANTIFLRGKDESQFGKIDTTKCSSNTARDRQYLMVKQALKEFVTFIKTGAGYAPSVANNPQVGVIIL